MSTESSSAKMGLRGLVDAAAGRLRAAGIEDARFEAELLLAHALGCTRVEVLAGTVAARVEDPRVREAFSRLLAGRERRVPFSYLTGAAEFYGRSFAVTPAVLVPRPETETLVELALQFLRHAGRRPVDDTLDHGRQAPRVLDIGSGSGCIAVTLACEHPGTRIVATDVSRTALAIARANAKRHGVVGRIRFLAGDMVAPFRSITAAGGLDARPLVGGPFDLVLCNPPYVSEPSLAACMPEVRDYEPRLATCGGPDGLTLIRRVLAGAPRVLAPGGTLLMEVAAGLTSAASTLARDAGRYASVRTVRDLAGIERVLVAAI